MKKEMKMFLGVCLLTTLLVSCKKDDNVEISKKNFLKVGDTEYVLAKGTMENYGKDNQDAYYNGYNIDLYLVSKEISITTDSDGYLDLSGSEQTIYFEMFSSKGTEFDNGDYVFSTGNNIPIVTFDEGGYNLMYSIDEDEIEITSGKVTIEKNGNEYNITIACKDSSGKSITGFYKGELQYFNYENASKPSDLKFSKINKYKK